MKLLKAITGSLLVYLFVLSASSPLSSCTKHLTVHDTTVNIVRDTTIIRDTTVIYDTVYDIKSGLVAYFNFNGANLNDSSGHNNNIVYNNAVATEDRNGDANNAFLFNGSSSYMRVTNSGSLNPNSITISVLVKVNGFYIAPCSINQILGKGYPDNVDGFYSIRFADTLNPCSSTPDINREVFTTAFGDDIPQGASAGGIAPLNISTGTWYSVIFTYDGQYSKIYINGQLKDVREKVVPFTPNNHDLYIGKHEDPTFPYYFNGVIDEIRIYNRALCGSAVQTLYSHGLN